MMERLRSGAEQIAAPLGQPFWPTGIIPPNLGSLRIGGDRTKTGRVRQSVALILGDLASTERSEPLEAAAV
jgi:hypothetical protein